MRSLLLLCASLAVSFLLGEGLFRLFLHEVDFLQPELLPHPVLGRTIAPGTAGHDAWGFRNRQVPDHAAIVAVGDSMTYGISATAQESWPSWLAQISGIDVYSLSLGGYGPKEYQELIEQKAKLCDPNCCSSATTSATTWWTLTEQPPTGGMTRRGTMLTRTREPSRN